MASLLSWADDKRKRIANIASRAYDQVNVFDNGLDRNVRQVTGPKRNVIQQGRRAAEEGVIKPVVRDVRRTANTLEAGEHAARGLVNIGAQSVFGTDQSYQRAMDDTIRAIDYSLNTGHGKAGSFLTSKQAATSGDGFKGLKENVVNPVIEGTSTVAPFAPALNVVKGSTFLAKTAKSAFQGGSVNAASNVGLQYAEDGTVNWGETAAATGIGTVAGAAAPALEVAGPKVGEYLQDKGPGLTVGGPDALARMSEARRKRLEKNNLIWTGPEGKQRYEIDDSKAKFRDYDEVQVEKENQGKLLSDDERAEGELLWRKSMSDGHTPEEAAKYASYIKKHSAEIDFKRNNPGSDNVLLGDILDHKKFYKDYPDAPNIGVLKDNTIRGDQAHTEVFDEATGPRLVVTIGKNTSPGTIMHEVQHTIQETEGLAGGGSVPDMIAPDEVFAARPDAVALRQRLRTLNEAIEDNETYNAMTPDQRRALQHERWDGEQQMSKIFEEERWKQYANRAGEVESETVRKRFNEGTKPGDKPFVDDMAIPYDQQIVKTDGTTKTMNAQQSATRMKHIRDGDERYFDYDTDKVARERFDIPNLRILNRGGSDRDVYDLGDGNVLKVAKNKRGLIQNQAENDYYAARVGLIPEAVESGLNYVVTKKMLPPDAKTRQFLKEFMRFDEADVKYDQRGAGEFLEKWGLEDIRNYDVLFGDLQSIRNWGTHPETGMPIHVDGGTLAGQAMRDAIQTDRAAAQKWYEKTGRYGRRDGTTYPHRQKNLDDPEFRAIYERSRAAKKKYGDTDTNTMYYIEEPGMQDIKGINEAARASKNEADFRNRTTPFRDQPKDVPAFLKNVKKEVALEKAIKNNNPNLVVRPEETPGKKAVMLANTEQQKTKKFQDTGEKMFGSAKDRAKFSRISIENLPDLEGHGDRIARAMVTKDRVLGDDAKYTVNEQGDPKAENLRKLLLDAIPSKPADSAAAREFYTKYTPEFAELVKTAPNFEALKQIVVRNNNYGQYQERSRLKQAMGAKFYNVVYGNSTAVRNALYRGPEDFSWNVKKTVTRDPNAAAKPSLHGGLVQPYKREGGKTLPKMTPAEVQKEFNIKGLEFGNWVKDSEAADALMRYADALDDMGDLIGMDMAEVMKQMNLGTGFGSRGRKGALAHYEPTAKVLNFTKNSGADGSLGHELSHAIDDWLGNGRGGRGNMASDGQANWRSTPKIADAYQDIMKSLTKGESKRPVRPTPKDVERFNRSRWWIVDDKLKNMPDAKPQEVVDAVLEGRPHMSEKDKVLLAKYVSAKTTKGPLEIPSKQSQFYSDAESLGEYWTRPTEMLARTFDAYLMMKSKAAGRHNNFLNHDRLFDEDPGYHPSAEHMKELVPMFDQLMKAIKEEKGIPDNKVRGEVAKPVEAEVPEIKSPTTPVSDSPKTDLAKEAKKYKTAEEFVTSQATLLHGTKADFSEFDPSLLGSNTGAPSAKKGFFFTDTPEIANHYANPGRNFGTAVSKNLEGAFDRISSRAKAEGLTNSLEGKNGAALIVGAWPKVEPGATKQQVLKAIMDKMDSLKTRFDDPDSIAKIDRFKAITRAELKNTPLTELELFGRVMKSKVDMKNPLVFDDEGFRNGKSYAARIDEALAKGHDGVIIKNSQDPLKGNIYVAFDKSQVLTEKQLTDIYNQANGVKPPAPKKPAPKVMPKVVSPVTATPATAKPTVKTLLTKKKVAVAKNKSYDSPHSFLKEHTGTTTKKRAVYKVVMKEGPSENTSGVTYPEGYTFVTGSFKEAKDWADTLDGTPAKIQKIETNQLYLTTDKSGKPVPVDDFYRARSDENSVWPGEAVVDMNSSSVVKEYNMAKPPVPPKKPPVRKSGTPQPPERGSKVRGFVKTAVQSGNTKQPVRDGLGGPKSTYDPIKNKDSFKKADKAIDKAGFERSVTKAKTSMDTSTETQALSLRVMDELQGSKRYEDAIDVVESISERATRNGQATQILAAYNRLKPEGILLAAQRQIRNAVKENPTKWKNLKMTPEQAKSLRASAEKVQAMEPGFDKDVATLKLIDEIKSVVPTTGARKFVTLWKAGLLTGIKGAFGGNLVGNTTRAALKKIADVPAAGIDAAFAQAFDNGRTKTFTLGDMFEGGVEGTQIGYRNFKAGVGAIDQADASKYDYGNVKVQYGNGPLGRAAQKYTDTVFNFYAANDRPFYYAALRNSLKDQALAAGKNKGLRGAELKAYADYTAKNPTEDMNVTAVEDALEAVFQDKNALGSALSWGKRGASRSQAGTVASEMLLPFTGVPSSVATALYHYSPAGGVVDVIQAFRAGRDNFDAKAQRKLSESLGKSLTGTGLMFVGASLVGAGQMTLGWPTDPQERAAWEENGKQPYSVKLGDHWRSLNYTGPIMAALAIGGQIQESRQDGKTFGDAITTGVIQSGKAIIGSSPLQGAQAGLNAVTDTARFGPTWVENMAGSFIPTIVKDVASAFDSKQREVNSPLDAIQNRIPGLKNKLMVKRGSFGQELERKTSAVGAVIDPFKSSKDNSNELTAEIERLEKAGFGVSPSKIDKKFTVDGFKFEMTPEQLNEYQGVVGAATQEAWKTVLADDRYKQLDDEEKKTFLQNITNATRKEALSQFSAKHGIGEYSAEFDGENTKSNTKSVEDRLSEVEEKRARDKFAASSEKTKTIGDTFYYKDKNGNVKSRKKYEQDYNVATTKANLEMDRAKGAGDIQRWYTHAETKAQALSDYIEKLDPETDAAKIASKQLELENLIETATKYQGYGNSFTKGRSTSSRSSGGSRATGTGSRGGRPWQAPDGGGMSLITRTANMRQILKDAKVSVRKV